MEKFKNQQWFLEGLVGKGEGGTYLPLKNLYYLRVLKILGCGEFGQCRTNKVCEQAGVQYSGTIRGT